MDTVSPAAGVALVGVRVAVSVGAGAVAEGMPDGRGVPASVVRSGGDGNGKRVGTSEGVVVGCMLGAADAASVGCGAAALPEGVAAGVCVGASVSASVGV